MAKEKERSQSSQGLPPKDIKVPEVYDIAYEAEELHTYPVEIEGGVRYIIQHIPSYDTLMAQARPSKSESRETRELRHDWDFVDEFDLGNHKKIVRLVKDYGTSKLVIYKIVDLNPNQYSRRPDKIIYIKDAG